MKVYQVEIDPNQEIDPENLQDLLAKGEEEGDVHEVKLRLAKEGNDHFRKKSFLNSFFGQILVRVLPIFCFLIVTRLIVLGQCFC